MEITFYNIMIKWADWMPVIKIKATGHRKTIKKTGIQGPKLGEHI